MLILQKWHSIGNDFLISKLELSKEEITRLCDRKFGIGADQFVLIQEEEKKVIRFFNQDGTEAEMCGNALKCVTSILHQETLKTEFILKTKKGLIECKIEEDGLSKVNLGKPLEVRALKEGFYVNLGNPHLVIFCKPNDDFIEHKGKEMQVKFSETNGINVSFVEVIDKQKLLVRTFERGVGETLSCGSGSCASFIASFNKGLVEGAVQVFNKGSKKVLAFKESCHLISFESENVVLRGKGTKVAEIKIY
jgi:diaminopimelate epimerase